MKACCKNCQINDSICHSFKSILWCPRWVSKELLKPLEKILAEENHLSRLIEFKKDREQGKYFPTLLL